MALNGTGTFTRLFTWATDALNGIKISSSRMDQEFDGIATALSTALYKDGQQTMAANLPMGGFKLTNLGAGSASTDSVRVAQIQNQIFGGRLTLTTAVPYLTSTVTSATTVYYTPAVHGFVSIFDGTLWIPAALSELSQATTDSTKSPLACSANSVYDIFHWSDSGTQRATRGPKWTSATGRGTGAGTTELVMVNGILMNANAITNGPAAQRGVYLGTIATDSIGRVNMKFGGSGAAGGEASRLGVWNAYNQTRTVVLNFDNTDTWNCASATWRAKNNNANNGIFVVTGAAHASLSFDNFNFADVNTTAGEVAIGIGVDSTTALHALCITGNCAVASSSGDGTTMVSSLSISLLGAHTVYPLETVGHGTAGANAVFYGDDGTIDPGFVQTMFRLTVMA